MVPKGGEGGGATPEGNADERDSLDTSSILGDFSDECKYIVAPSSDDGEELASSSGTKIATLCAEAHEENSQTRMTYLILLRKLRSSFLESCCR